MPIRLKRSVLPVLLAATFLLLTVPPSPGQAQVAAATDEDLNDAPPQFKESLSNGRIKPDPSELTRQDIHGAPPSKNPRDLNGMYNFLRTPVTKPAGGQAASGGPPAPPKPAGPGPRPSSVGAGACMLSGFPGLTSYSTTILNNDREVVFLMEENHLLRWARMADKHDPAAQPSFQGDSIAHWDGDTLVIDTTQVRVRGSDAPAHYLERATKLPDGNISIDRFQVADDGQETSVERLTLRWRPDLHYVEDICEDFGEAFGVGYK